MNFGRQFLGKVIIGSLILALIVLGTSTVLKDQYDPLWSSLDSRLNSSLDHSKQQKESFYRLYSIFNNKLDNEEIFNLLLKRFIGFYPTISSSKINLFANEIMKPPHRLIIQGVTGTGNTTLIRTLGFLIAGDSANILEAYCVQNFELKFNSQYIGDFEGDKFHKGLFLEFLDRAKTSPTKNFVFIIHDIGKIYPETFFGPEVWRELEDVDGNYPNKIGKFELSLPPNFYLLSNKLEGASSSNHLDAQHFSRLGNLVEHKYDADAFADYLHSKVLDSTITADYRKQLTYLYIKANLLVERLYSPDFTIGQWSNLRKLIRPDDLDEFIHTFLSHVNAFKPQQALRKEDFDEIIFAMKNQGLLNRSSLFDNFYKTTVELGLFSEFVVGISFIIVTSAIGRYLFLSRRNRFAKELLSIEKLFGSNYSRDLIVAKKIELKHMIEDGRLTHVEAIFIRNYINDKMEQLSRKG